MATVEKALKLIRNLPRVSLNNLKPLPGSTKLFKNKKERGQHGGKTCGRGHKGQGQHGTLPRYGFEGGATPFYLRIPKEPYYKGHHLRREYPPLTLLQLQRMIDCGMINSDEPIDLTTICNSKLYQMNPAHNHYGINLTDEGADIFAAKVNIEVQWASEQTIAAVEKNGGVISTRFYDLLSLHAKIDPLRFLKRGVPLFRCKLPPQDAIGFYTDPKSRGYLADPALIAKEKFELAQKYGYELPDLSNDPKKDMLLKRKDPREIFYGLAPGSVVNLKDKTVLKPITEEYEEFYRS